MSYLSRFLKVSLVVVMLGLQVMTSLGVIADDRTEYEDFDDFYDDHFAGEFDLELTRYADVNTSDEGLPAISGYVPEMLFAEDTLPFVEGELFLPIEPHHVPATGSGVVQFVLEPVNWNPSWGTLAQARAAAMNVATVYHRFYANQTTNNMAAAVNGAFGRDAIYLGQSANGNRLRVMIGAFEGYVPRVGQQRNITASVNGTNRTFAVTANAMFVPFNNYPNNTNNTTVRTVSHYVNRNGGLYRYLTNNVTTTGGFTRFLTGPAPSWMTVNTRYYSFDGVYFYRNPRNIRGNGSGAVNANQPFFNYFQYLSFRSASRVTAAQLNNFLHNELGTVANRNNSVLTGQGVHFINAQNRYGVNALLSYSKALHESNRGLSSIARNNNNVFGLNAIDATPGQSASVFRDVQHSVNDYANNWMSRGYLWPGDWRYEGPHAGHKGSGMNVRYATDPYWGQKIAGWAFRIDRTLNHQDFNREQIAIRQNTSTVAVTNVSGATTLYTANPRQVRFFPFLVTGTSGNRLSVLTDAPIVNGVANQTALFNRNNAIGYIPNSNVWLIGTPTSLEFSSSLGVMIAGGAFRTGPSTAHASMRTLAIGTTLEILGSNADGRWLNVRIANQVGWAFADSVRQTTRYGVMTAGGAFRTGPSTAHASMRTLTQGTSLEILSSNADGRWLNVRIGNQVGWAFADSVRQTTRYGVMTVGGAFRTGPSTAHASMRTLTQGTSLEILGSNADGRWLNVRIGNQIGWAFAASTTQSTRLGVMTAGGAFRTGPSTAHASMRTLTQGTTLEILGSNADGRWLNVRIGSQVGWAFAASVTEFAQQGITTASVNLRHGPGIGFGIMRTLLLNTRLDILANHGNWMHVRTGNQVGWVSNDFARSTTRGARITSPAGFRVGPGTNFGSMRTLTANTSVTILGHLGNWSLVRIGQTTGWVHNAHIQ